MEKLGKRLAVTVVRTPSVTLKVKVWLGTAVPLQMKLKVDEPPPLSSTPWNWVAATEMVSMTRLAVPQGPHMRS